MEGVVDTREAGWEEEGDLLGVITVIK